MGGLTVLVPASFRSSCGSVQVHYHTGNESKRGYFDGYKGSFKASKEVLEALGLVVKRKAWHSSGH
jgi:hypothetical protein